MNETFRAYVRGRGNHWEASANIQDTFFGAFGASDKDALLNLEAKILKYLKNSKATAYIYNFETNKFEKEDEA